MRSFLVLNPKGGSGKSTLATNIAVYLSHCDRKVALADLDPQCTSNDWLDVRPKDRPRIFQGCDNAKNVIVDDDTDYLVIDSPAGLSGKRLAKFIKNSDATIVPVNASSIDTRAAERFFQELHDMKEKINKKVKLATVANRVREETLAADKVEDYLSQLLVPSGKQMPFLTKLRQSQNYVNAAEAGLGIFELPQYKTVKDRDQWTPLLQWLSQIQ